MKKSLADIATMGNGVCGLIAIFFIMGGRHMLASLLIFFAYSLDGLDGALARRFGSAHRFGRYLDSFSDSISFCLAPVMLFYANFHQNAFRTIQSSFLNFLVVASLCIFGVSGLIRLVRFVRKYHTLDCFRGFPLPLAAVSTIMMCSLLGPGDKNAFSFGYQPYAACVFILFLSFIMTSKIGFPKIDRDFFLAALIGSPFVLLPFISAMFDVQILPSKTMGILEASGFIPILYYLFRGPFYQIKKSKKSASI
ncbi:MAG: CDP-alcohol phosphatidyltransferase family protein [Candidatus Aminicenantes bacterium]|nr:CDP-alcohol phosphatidyltransferase family protein [Candidatus Aminicenantes bacterium]